MRGESQSLKVSEWLAEHLRSLDSEAEVLDLHKFKLPIFDDGETNADNRDDLLQQLDSADAYVFVSPEWNGMMSHGLINMIHHANSTSMAHKPVMLVGVSAGRGGTYPIAQMLQIGQKNRHYVISPERLIVGGVKDMLNNHDMSDDTNDIAVKERADYALKILLAYAEATQLIRESGVVDHENFANGV